MTFLNYDNSGLVYTPRPLQDVFSYKLNLLRPDRENYHNLKEVYSFELSKKKFGSVDKTKPYPKLNSSE